LPALLELAATAFLLPGFASSVIQTARAHGDGFMSLWVWLAMEGLFVEGFPFWLRIERPRSAMRSGASLRQCRPV